MAKSFIRFGPEHRDLIRETLKDWIERRRDAAFCRAILEKRWFNDDHRSVPTQSALARKHGYNSDGAVSSREKGLVRELLLRLGPKCDSPSEAAREKVLPIVEMLTSYERATTRSSS